MRPLHSQRSCFDDRQHGRFDGVVEEFRYRLLDRDHAPFALAIGAEPHWSRVDETTGEPVDNYGGDLLIAVDKELIKGRRVGASRLRAVRSTFRDRSTSRTTRTTRHYSRCGHSSQSDE